MKPLIVLEDIVKDYRTMRALDGVNLEIAPGITGLLGPNGAGKSTLIKVLLGLVRVSKGQGTMLGHRLGSEGRAVRNKVGYMPEDDCYIPGMTGIEVVQFSACLAGLPSTEALRRAHEILDFCGMHQERYRTIETFSTGMRQKIKFASAIVHDPEFLIFDEPTSGLDPEERESLLNRIRILSTTAGKSVLLATHILPDVQEICDNVLILSRGKVRLSQTLEELNRPTSASISVRVKGDADSLVDRLKLNGCFVEKDDDGFLVISDHESNPAGVEIDRGDITIRIKRIVETFWQAAHQSNTPVQSLTPARNSLEAIFMSTVHEADHASS